MKSKKYFVLLALVMGIVSPRLWSEETKPIDEGKIIASIKKLVSVPPNWTTRITGLKVSSIPGLYEATLEVSQNENVQKQIIFISTDSRYYILGNIYDAAMDMDAERQKLVHLEGSPSKGTADAPVTMVEFSDFQCASCKKAHETMKNDKLLDQYEGKVKLVFKNYPLSEHHKWAMKAAVAAMCAQKQNPKAFWKMADDIFGYQGQIDEKNLTDKVTDFAKKDGLDMKKFQECYEKDSTADQVNADIADGKALGVSMTPTFLINGRAIVGYRDSNEFKQVIDEFLQKSKN